MSRYVYIDGRREKRRTRPIGMAPRWRRRPKRQSRGFLLDTMKRLWPPGPVTTIRPQWAVYAFMRGWMTGAQYDAVPAERVETGSPGIVALMYEETPLFRLLKQDTVFP